MKILASCMALAAGLAFLTLPLRGLERSLKVADNLYKVTGRDAKTGAAYERWMLTGGRYDGSGPLSLLTLQCAATDGSRQTDLLVKFGGVGHIKYRSPVAKPGQPPPVVPNPMVDLLVGFNGAHTMMLQFEEFPTGQLKYRAPGPGSRNTADVPFLLHWMVAGPTVSVSFYKNGVGNVSAIFETQTLLRELRTSQVCEK